MRGLLLGGVVRPPLCLHYSPKLRAGKRLTLTIPANLIINLTRYGYETGSRRHYLTGITALPVRSELGSRSRSLAVRFFQLANHRNSRQISRYEWRQVTQIL